MEYARQTGVTAVGPIPWMKVSLVMKELSMPLLSVQGIRKQFKEVTAVDDVSFDLEEGEFLSLLGPSGCGKTTTLRVIAGLEILDAGRILLQEEDVTYEPPFRRNIGMVFQDYALFPHMTINDNVAFGLRMQNVDKEAITRKVDHALELVHLGGYGSRYPNQLSGGQQQRVALARALAVEPALLLLDEPLSNLDAKLREEMRIEIKLIQREIGISTLFVTHDQEEALTMSDRVIVMERGKISEIGSPMEIYSNPTSEFVADFIGHSNLLQGVVDQVVGEEAFVTIDDGLKVVAGTRPGISAGMDVLVLIRQERIRLGRLGAALPESKNIIEASLSLTNFLGPTIHYICNTEQREIHLRRPNEGKVNLIQPGERVQLFWNPDDCVLIPKA